MDIYPNPAENKVRIKLSQRHIQGTLTISSMDGHICYSNSVSNDTYIEVSVRGWAKGSYLVQLRCRNGQATTEKMIVS